MTAETLIPARPTSLTPLRVDTGAVAGFYCAAVEATDTVLSQDCHAAERERLARMFEQAPGFMALLSGPDHVFELANAA